MIKYNDKPVAIYNGDYKPMNEYRNGVKVGGYKEVTLEGKTITADGTYNDALDLTLNGHHSQHSENAIKFNQLLADSLGDEKSKVIEPTITNIHVGGDSIDIKTIVGHKYLYTFCGKIEHQSSTIDTITAMYFALYNNSKWTATGWIYAYKDGNQWVRKDYIFEAYQEKITFQHGRTDNYHTSDAITAHTKNIMLFDLTAMFGEGKEPTAEEFRKMFPCDYYPYNEGEWMYAPKGSYVKFNQLIENGDFSEGLGNFVMGYATSYSIENNWLHQILRKPVDTSSNVITLSENHHNLKGKHRYLYSLSVKKSWAGRMRIVWYERKRRWVILEYIFQYPTANERIDYIGIAKASADSDCFMIIYPWNGGMTEAGETLDVSNIKLIDLTEMFGEGNEPTTVEEFKALYPNEYYEYTEGRYEDTGGFVVDGEVVPNDVDTAFVTPFPEMPEPIIAVANPKVMISSNGVLFNQLLKQFSSYPYVKNGDTADQTSWVKNEDGSVDFVLYGSGCYISMPDSIYTDGHKYFQLANVKNGSIQNSLGFEGYRLIIAANFDGDIYSVFAPTRRRNIVIGYQHQETNYTLKVRSFFLCDLTLMFGAGNEPTAEQFRTMFPLNYYPYDAGTFRTIKALHEVTPTEHVLPFTLYGANGVYDTCEPNVLVDGVRKCRVTRRWWTPDNTRLDWQLETPVIELYDPIDIRTLPISTIITNDQECDMNANIKVIDN